MENGQVLFDGPPKQVFGALPQNHAMITALPAATKIFHLLNGEGTPPITIREGQRWLLNKQFNLSTALTLPMSPLATETTVVLEAKDIAFRYEKNGMDVLHHFNLKVQQGEFLTIIGVILPVPWEKDTVKT